MKKLDKLSKETLDTIKKNSEKERELEANISQLENDDEIKNQENKNLIKLIEEAELN